MITISVAALATFIMKAFLLIVVGLFAALVILYPINDSPTTMSQFVIFFIVVVIIVDVLFVRYFPFTIQFTP